MKYDANIFAAGIIVGPTHRLPGHLLLAQMQGMESEAERKWLSKAVQTFDEHKKDDHRSLCRIPRRAGRFKRKMQSHQL